jgi:DNA-binding XRE family transcriptional regulator
MNARIISQPLTNKRNTKLRCPKHLEERCMCLPNWPHRYSAVVRTNSVPWRALNDQAVSTVSPTLSPTLLPSPLLANKGKGGIIAPSPISGRVSSERVAQLAQGRVEQRPSPGRRQYGVAPFVSSSSLLCCLRTAAGLTQEKLAAASGLGVRTISDLERGLADRPRASTMSQLAAALREPPRSLQVPPQAPL